MTVWDRDFTADELGDVLRRLSDAYYNGDAEVSDDVYDALRDRLAAMRPSHPALKEIGAPIRSERAKAALPYRMGSLDKWKAEDAQVQQRLARWMREHKGPYTVSQKLDGSSCLLVWRKTAAGRWEPSLYTRGDGTTGVDIGHLAPYLIPKAAAGRIDDLLKGTGATELALRGELLVPREVFVRKYADMARPRSLVNGLVNRKEVARKQVRDVDLVLYEVVSPRLPKSEQMRRLSMLGLPVVEHRTETRPLDAAALEAHLRQTRIAAKYDMDGLVIEAEGPYPLSNDRTPEYAVAFKASEDALETRVVGVKWTASKDGLWKPTVEYEPVIVAGTVLRNATGFHGQFIRDQGIGPGAVIRVGLGGDVVPQVLEVVRATGTPQFPPPDDFVWDERGVEIRLSDRAAASNPELRRAQLQHFVTTLGIPHLSEGTLRKLQEAGIDTIPALLGIDAKAVAGLPGLGDKSAQRLIEGIREKTRDVPLARLMAASNTFGRGFAEKRLQMILEHHPRLMDETAPPSVRALCQIDGIEEKTAQRFLDGLVRFRAWLPTVARVSWTGAATARPETRDLDAAWVGQTVVFTGFRNETLRAALESRGAVVADTVSRKTTVLVSKDGETSSSKAKKALEVGARVIDRATLERELGLGL